jgi:hypothetical protein
MFDQSVVGRSGLLAALSPDYVLGTMKINDTHKEALRTLATRGAVASFQKETGITPRSTDALLNAATIIAKYPSVDTAVPELRKAGIRTEDMQDIVKYVRDVAGDADKNGDKKKAQNLGALAEELQRVASMIPVPDYTSAGNAAAAERIRETESASAVSVTRALVRNEVVAMIAREASISHTEAETLYSTYAHGTMSASEGSDREVTFNVNVNIPNLGISVKASGTVNNNGGLEGEHSVIRRNVITEAYSPVG